MDSGPEVRSKVVRKFLLLDVRIRLYEKVQELRKESKTYKQVIDEIERDYDVRLPKSTTSYWTREISVPLRAGHAFVPKPSPELAYVIGVETGDGFLNVKRDSHQYRVRLSAIDREFVEAFSEAVQVLSCPVHVVWKGVTARGYQVEYGNFLLHKFLLT